MMLSKQTQYNCSLRSPVSLWAGGQRTSGAEILQTRDQGRQLGQNTQPPPGFNYRLALEM